MSFVNVMRLQKRQKAPTNTKSNEGFLAPFPTVPPILETGKINNNPPLDNTVTESNDDGGNEIEIFGLIGGALVVIILIGIFIKKKLIGDSKKSDRNAYRSSSSQNLIDDLNEQGKNSPIMIEQNSTQFVTSSPRTYDPPHSDSNDPRLGPSSVNKNLYSLQNKNPNSKQDLSHSPDSYRGPSLDDDSIHLSHSPFNPNFQQKDPSYPSDPYKRSSRDGYSSPYLPQSSFPPNTPNTPNTPHTPPYPPNAYGQDDYPSPYLSPFTPNTPNTPNTPLYPPNTYGVPSQDDYPSPYLPKSLFTPNTPNTPSYPPNSYVGSQNNQSYRNSQHFQQQYPLDPTQGTLLSSYQPQQYRSSPNSPHSLEDPPRSPLFSKIEPVPTNDQNSMSYQDTPLDPTIGNNINSDDANENLSINSDITNNELKELNDMIANIIHSENVHSSLPNHISDSSFAGLLSDIPKTSTDEKSNRPDSQASSIYSVQPNQGMGQIEMASKNKIPSSNLNHDHDLPQSAAIGYIEPMQSNMVIERVNEPSGTSEVQLNMTQPITTGFIQPSQSSMKIEKVDGDTTFRPEISAPIMTRVENQASPKPMYDIVGIKKHAEMILNAKAEKKFDLNNESNSEKVTKNNETQNDENVIEKNDGNQGEPLVRKKSVRFRSESNANQEEEIKVSKPKKSILINKKDAINVQSSALKSENGYDSGDDKANNRDSKLNSYYFDISGYQEDTHLANEEQS